MCSRLLPSPPRTCSLLQLGNTDLPEQSPDLTQIDSIPIELIKTLHHVLLEVSPIVLSSQAQVEHHADVFVLQIIVQDGTMVCPSCEHVFVIKESIPNMVRTLCGFFVVATTRRDESL